MKTLWLLCFITAVNAYANYEEEARIRHIRSTKAYLANVTNEAADAADGRFGGNIVTSVMDGVVLVFNIASNTAVGPGVVVAAKWALCSSLILPSNIAETGILIYSGVVDSDPASLAAGKKHTVRTITRHGSISGRKNSLLLLQGCPGFNSFITLPNAGSTYSLGTEAGFLNLDPTALKLASKKIGEVCECEKCPGWDKDMQICMEESNAAYNEKLGSLLYINNAFVGIGTCGDIANGEAYIDISKYLTFISDNAV